MWCLRGQLDLDGNRPLLDDDRQVGPVKTWRSARKLAHLGAGDGPPLDPLEQPKLALAQNALGPELLAELERRGRAAEPMIDGAGRDDRGAEAEARVAQASPRCPQQARLLSQQVKTLQQPAFDAGRDPPISRRAPHAQSRHDVLYRHRAMDADEPNQLPVSSQRLPDSMP